MQRDPVTYNETWLAEYQPNQTYYLNSNLRRQMEAQGQRVTDHEPAGTYARKIYNRLLIDLSYNSSRLEGNTYSLLDTEKLIIEGINVSSKLDEEATMILNHKEAIRYLVENANPIQTEYNEILTLHFLLSDGLVSSKYAGKLRDYGVRIGASCYSPLENQLALEKQLHKTCNVAAKIIHPYEQSFFLLVHIAYLQAFADVNKRTSRLSANIPLIKNNLVPLSFNDIDKDDYISAMISIYEINDVTIEAIGFDKIRVRYREQRRRIVAEIISQKLVGPALKEYVEHTTNQGIPEKDPEWVLHANS